MRPKKVAILGAGVGGLSAAHELAERGFDVTVYEALCELGGKARSFRVIGRKRERALIDTLQKEERESQRPREGVVASEPHRAVESPTAYSRRDNKVMRDLRKLVDVDGAEGNVAVAPAVERSGSKARTGRAAAAPPSARSEGSTSARAARVAKEVPREAQTNGHDATVNGSNGAEDPIEKCLDVFRSDLRRSPKDQTPTQELAGRLKLLDREVSDSNFPPPMVEPAKKTFRDAGEQVAEGLPAEHGFHFFPAFYRHLPDTMRRIPYGYDPTKPTLHPMSVADNLVVGPRVLVASANPDGRIDLPRDVESFADAASLVKMLLSLGLAPEEAMLAAQKLLDLLSRPADRWGEEYDQKTWWDFIEAEGKSEAYQLIVGNVAVRWTVAMDPKKASARTIGRIALQFWKDALANALLSDPSQARLDRVLNGPTTEVWFDPWWAYLKKTLGVKFKFGWRVNTMECDGEGVSSVEFETSDGKKVVARRARAAGDAPAGEDEFDYVIAAVPVEVMLKILKNSPDLKRADPAWLRLTALEQSTAWMMGVQFYLKKDVPIAPGGIFLKDSPWAMTGISQTQFWQAPFKTFKYQRENGPVETVRTVLSIIISNWEAAGAFQGKRARACDPDELYFEVWSELKRHLNNSRLNADSKPIILLEDHDVVDWHYEKWQGQWVKDHWVNGKWVDDEQLFINKVGSWNNRPDATTNVRNFFLAADYVRTNTDLATMEAANEAARRAVNGILQESGSPYKPCDIWPLGIQSTSVLASLAQNATQAATRAGARALKDSTGFLTSAIRLWKKL
jgi:uncharacterized protein with NAD-binding domain and iron-sulfur cluster